LVEEYGLELYDELFDYDFDKIHDLDKRIHALVDNVERIAQVYSEQYKDNMLQTIHSKMVRNKQKLTDYGKSKENIVPKSFEFLFNNAVPYTTYGHTHYLQQYIDYYISKGWL
jgi:DNA repair exonuclease SbcCD ATPase subunit